MFEVYDRVVFSPYEDDLAHTEYGVVIEIEGLDYYVESDLNEIFFVPASQIMYKV